jgi:acetaldehyde dehydrogenase/alcohol dehydrogenase
MELLRLPKKVYFKPGSLPVALRELAEVYNKKTAFLVTSPSEFNRGVLDPVIKVIRAGGLRTCEFFNQGEVATLEGIKSGLPKINEFEPDVIIGVGDSSAMSTAKILRLLYEVPDADLAALASGKAPFPALGKTDLVLIPTTAGSGREVDPYAEYIDDKGKKQWLFSYEMLPLIASIDADFTADLSPEKTKEGALEALKNAIAAAGLETGNFYMEGLDRDAAVDVFKYTQEAMEKGPRALVAREKLSYAAALAGMAYASAAVGAPPVEGVAISKLITSGKNKERLTDLAVACGFKDTKALSAGVKKLEAL